MNSSGPASRYPHGENGLGFLEQFCFQFWKAAFELGGAKDTVLVTDVIQGRLPVGIATMAHYYDTSDFRNNLKVELDGSPFQMTYFQFVEAGKGTAFTRTKLKNMITGAVIERTFRTGEKVKAADIEEHSMQFLYEDGEFHHFMNNESYEQVAVTSETIANEARFLTENIEVDVLFYNGNPISVALPNTIESEIVFVSQAYVAIRLRV